MSKNEKPKLLLDWKTGNRFVLIGGILVSVAGGGIFAVQSQANAADAATLKSAFPTPPLDTTVNWENNKPLYYEVDQTGKEHPKPQLLLGDGVTPSWCLGLGIPLPNNSTTAQADESNKLFAKLNGDQKAIINNVAYLGRKEEGLEGYAEAQHAIYLLLDEAGISVNQAKDVVVKSNTLLQDANKIKDGANKLISQAKNMRKLPSFNNSTIELIQGVEKTVTDSNSVLPNFPYTKNNVDGLTISTNGNDLKLKAGIKTKHGTINNAVQMKNLDNNIPDNYIPWFIFSTDGDSTGDKSQTVLATQDPSQAKTQFNINIIGLGELKVTKKSENTKFDASLMAGAEYSIFYKNGTAVKWSDGQSGYPISVTNGTKANNTNAVLKVGTDATFGVKNLPNDKEYYFVETKAPAGFALDEAKHAFTFDENSSFNSATSNYHVDGESKEKPTGSTSLVKYDADTNNTDTQGKGDWDGIVYGLFYTKDDTAVKWTDGIKSLPIAITYGTKDNDTNVELKLDKDNKVGVQNLDLSSNDQFYWKELRTSKGYSLSTKHIPVDFTGKEAVDVSTNDFGNNKEAQNKALALQLQWWKAQDVNGSLTGLDGAGFTAKPLEGTKGKPVTVFSKSTTDANGFTKNGYTIFDGKANTDAGNASPDGLAWGDYEIEETTVPDGTQAINPFTVKTSVDVDDKGTPKAYKIVIQDTVTGQVISSSSINADKVTDNNILLKLDLGTITDKPTEKLKPTIQTQAHSKDGDKVIQVNEVSEKTAMYDIADFTNIEKGDRITSKLHRLVTDKDGKVTSDKVVQILKFTADDETVKSQQHRFDTTADTTKDFDIPDGSTVTYVFTEDIVDKDADPDTGKPEATHDDLKDKDQTLTVEKVTPSIDVEKANAKVPDAGNGNHTDKDNNIGVNDHDTEETYFEVKPKAETKIFFRGTNNGNEPLNHIKIVDKTTNGSVNIKGMTFTYNDKKLTVNKDGEFELDGKLLVLQPKESVIGSGTLDALPEGELHGDKVTIDGIGVYSKKHVSDDDKWYGKVDKKTKSIVEKVAGSLPKTGEGKAALGISIFGAALLGLAAYLKRNWIVSTYRKTVRKIRK